MCNRIILSEEREKIEEWYDAKFDETTYYEPGIFNAFAVPATPVITNRDIHRIEMYQWGFLAPFAKDAKFRHRHGRIETLSEKASFKTNIQNRCLVLANGFVEWKWLDEKGKVKEKYQITFPGGTQFAIAGIYNSWTDKSSGEILNTHMLLTTEANELMSQIHITETGADRRMPVMLKKEDELKWLQGEDHMAFAEFNEPLVATKVD